MFICSHNLLPTVEIAVKHLEDDPTFNAGHGSALNIAGEIEMDAIIMDGRTLGCGAVTGVRNIANPVPCKDGDGKDQPHYADWQRCKQIC